jgi:hypothetical protein
MITHNCNNLRCGGNFSGQCRQVYFTCSLHMMIGTDQQRALEDILKEKGKDFYKEYRKYIK